MQQNPNEWWRQVPTAVLRKGDSRSAGAELGPGYGNRRYACANRWDATHEARIARHLEDPPSRVLEVGCGAGHLTARLAARGWDIVGIDANPHAAEIAVSGLVRTMRAEALEFDDDTFDTIVAVHTIEHIPQLENALAEMGRVLRPGGRAIFVYPAEPIMGLYAIPTSIIIHGSPFKARDVHCQKLWPAKLRRMVEPLGWMETHHQFELFKSPQFTSTFQSSPTTR